MNGFYICLNFTMGLRLLRISFYQLYIGLIYINIYKLIKQQQESIRTLKRVYKSTKDETLRSYPSTRTHNN